MHPQLQSSLFDLSAELRTQIFSLALSYSYPDQFLHIIEDLPTEREKFISAGPLKPFVGQYRHRLCSDDDKASPDFHLSYPTWQHPCFGQWCKRDRSDRDRVKFYYAQSDVILPGSAEFKVRHSEDNMLSLLLSCSRAYEEALPLLYQENVFSFQRACTLNDWKARMPARQWEWVRNIHISTILEELCFKYTDRLSPERLDNWIRCCLILDTMKLRFLKVELQIRYAQQKWERKHGPCDVEDKFIGQVLGPLKDVRADTFEIEFDLPGRMPKQPWNAVADMGQVGFELTIVDDRN